MQNLNDIKIGTLSRDGKVHVPTAIPFSEAWEDTESSLYISDIYNNGDFDWQFALESVQIPDDDDDDQFMVALSVIKTFDCLPTEKQKSVQESVGIENTPDASDIHSYGLNAPVEHCLCTEAEVAGHLERMRSEVAPRVKVLFGFYLDRPVNRIGTTGWECLDGDFDSAMQRLCNEQG